MLRSPRLLDEIGIGHVSATTFVLAWSHHGRCRNEAALARLAGDKNSDTEQFVADVRAAGFTPHVAQNNTNRRSAIDGRTTGHAGYDVSRRIRKRVKEPFGWVKTVGQGHKLRDIGQERNRAGSR